MGRYEARGTVVFDTQSGEEVVNANPLTTIVYACHVAIAMNLAADREREEQRELVKLLRSARHYIVQIVNTRPLCNEIDTVLAKHRDGQ